MNNGTVVECTAAVATEIQYYIMVSSTYYYHVSISGRYCSMNRVYTVCTHYSYTCTQEQIAVFIEIGIIYYRILVLYRKYSCTSIAY